MRSSVITVPANALPEDMTGYVLATKPSLPIPADETHPARHVLHVEPGRAIPEWALQVIVDGNVTEWHAEQIAGSWPNAVYVLEAEYEGPDGLVRCKMIEVPEGVTPSACHIVGHSWFGDTP